MSHVDEGALHAYLDGALDEYPAAEAERIREHLEGCGACAERLEQERLIRSDAHAILGLAAPEVELPSLEELRTYVKRTRPMATTFSVRMYRLGWAASVALALGTGWILRGGVSRGPAVSGEAARSGPAVGQSLAGAAAEQPVVGQSAAAPASMEGAVAGMEPARESESSPSRQVAATPTEGSARDAAAAGGGAMRAPVTFDANEELATDVVAEADLRDEGVVDEAETAGALDAPMDFVTSAELVADAADTGAGASVGSLAAKSAVRPVAAAAPMTATAEPELTAEARAEDTASDAAPAAPDSDAVGAQERSTETIRAATPMPVTSAMEQSGRAARRAQADDEAAVVTGPSLVVPGLEVVSVTNLGQGTTALGVYVVQRLEDGAPLEIYHLEPGVARDRIPPLADGTGEVVHESDEGLIVLRAPRPQVELEALLARLFPEAEGVGSPG